MIDLDEMLEVTNNLRENNEQKRYYSDKFLAELEESNGDR